MVAGLYRAGAGHPFEPGQEASQVPGGDHSGEAAPNEPLPGLLGGQLDQLAVPKAHPCTTKLPHFHLGCSVSCKLRNDAPADCMSACVTQNQNTHPLMKYGCTYALADLKVRQCLLLSHDWTECRCRRGYAQQVSCHQQYYASAFMPSHVHCMRATVSVQAATRVHVNIGHKKDCNQDCAHSPDTSCQQVAVPW